MCHFSLLRGVTLTFGLIIRLAAVARLEDLDVVVDGTGTVFMAALWHKTTKVQFIDKRKQTTAR